MPAPKTAESQTESVDFDVLVAIIGAVDEGEEEDISLRVWARA